MTKIAEPKELGNLDIKDIFFLFTTNDNVAKT